MIGFRSCTMYIVHTTYMYAVYALCCSSIAFSFSLSIYIFFLQHDVAWELNSLEYTRVWIEEPQFQVTNTYSFMVFIFIYFLSLFGSQLSDSVARSVSCRRSSGAVLPPVEITFHIHSISLLFNFFLFYPKLEFGQIFFDFYFRVFSVVIRKSHV